MKRLLFIFVLFALLVLIFSNLAYPVNSNFKSSLKSFFELNELAPYDQPENWKSLGPINISGRMLSVAVVPSNPNTLYAGSAGGGLWRTFNSINGEGWHRVSTGFPAKSISAIAVDPNDENIIYIGTGEVYKYKQQGQSILDFKQRGSFGIGVLKTENGGQSWQQSLYWQDNEQTAISDIVINPHNSKSILAATTEGIYKSTNAGRSWRKVLSVIMARQILYFPDDTLNVFASCGNFASTGSGVYSSLNGGESWLKNESFPLFNGTAALAAFQDDDNVVLYASVADTNRGQGIYKSIKKGSRWERITPTDVTVNLGWYSNWIAVNQTNDQRILNAGIFVNETIDAGQSLSTILGTHSGNHDYCVDPEKKFIIYIATDGGVYRSSRFGDYFVNISFGINTAQFNKGIATSITDSTYILAGTQNNGMLRYFGNSFWGIIDPGSSPQYTLNPDVGSYAAINNQNENLNYITFGDNLILKSEDRSSSYREVGASIYGESAFLAPLAISMTHPENLFTATNRVFKSSNNAQSWNVLNNDSVLDSNVITVLGVSPLNRDFIVAGTTPIRERSHVYKSTDGGTTWNDITGILPDNMPLDIVFDKNNENSFYISFENSTSEQIFKTVNGGNSWENISNDLPNVAVNAVLVDPVNSQYIYAGNEMGVFVSDNQGTSWHIFNKGLPEVKHVSDLTFSESNRKIRMTTYGSGIFETKPAYQPAFYFETKIADIPQTRLFNFDDTLTFALSVKNWGINSYDESFIALLSIKDSSGNSIAEIEDDLCCFAPDDQKQVELYQFKAPKMGKYTATYSLPNALNSAKENFIQEFEIINPAIIKPEIVKEYKPYRMINSKRKITTSPIVDLPFPFIFDGYTYTRVRISTNGFVEFGSGENGTMFGLSTDTQLDGHSNFDITSTNRPTKVIAPWWENLSLGPLIFQTGVISYITEDIPPNRVFVMQWDNLETAGTTRLNFQVKLYENDNHIEFCYGDIIPGLYYGYGAVIGLKDHIGGDYHFFDISKERFNRPGETPTFRSPITHWPGPDSAYVIRTRTSQDDYWNIPSGSKLRPPFPNPFNSSVNISYKLPENTLTKVTIEIYDLLGRKIRTLLNRKQTDGNKQITWDGLNNLNQVVSSGVYLVVMRTKNEIFSKKITLLH